MKKKKKKRRNLRKSASEAENPPFCSFQINNPVNGFGLMTTVPADNITEKQGHL